MDLSDNGFAFHLGNCAFNPAKRDGAATFHLQGTRIFVVKFRDSMDLHLKYEFSDNENSPAKTVADSHGAWTSHPLGSQGFCGGYLLHFTSQQQSRVARATESTKRFARLAGHPIPGCPN